MSDIPQEVVAEMTKIEDKLLEIFPTGAFAILVTPEPAAKMNYVFSNVDTLTQMYMLSSCLTNRIHGLVDTSNSIQARIDQEAENTKVGTASETQLNKNEPSA